MAADPNTFTTAAGTRWRWSRRPDPRGALRGALPRIALLLTLALLPVGAITVLQAWRADEAARDAASAVLIARTAREAAPERGAIVSALDRARGLAAALAVFDPGAADCNGLMRRAVADWPHVPFVGVLAEDGSLFCAARGRLSPGGLPERASPGGPRISPTSVLVENAHPDASGDDRARAILAVVPIPADGPIDRAGAQRPRAVALALVPRPGERPPSAADTDRAVIVSFDRDGTILTSGMTPGALGAFLPMGRALAGLADNAPTAFAARTASGALRGFAVVPLVEGEVFALGSWPGDAAAGLPGAPFERRNILVPALLWLAGIVAALLAVNGMILRHLGALGMRMRGFVETGAGRRAPGEPVIPDRAPREIRDMAAAFQRIAARVIADEAELARAMQERGVLLRELHHRVKNNLQMIASILNMQLRATDDPVAAGHLVALRERIASLAAAHSALWRAPSLARVRADTLLDALVEELHDTARAVDGGGIAALGPVRREMGPAILAPEEAAAFAMLAAEAIAAIVRRVADPGAGGDVGLVMRLSHVPSDGALRLEVANAVPVGAGAPTPPQPDICGALMRAFAGQLGGRVDIFEADGIHRVTLAFVPRAAAYAAAPGTADAAPGLPA